MGSTMPVGTMCCERLPTFWALALWHSQNISYCLSHDVPLSTHSQCTVPNVSSPTTMKLTCLSWMKILECDFPSVSSPCLHSTHTWTWTWTCKYVSHQPIRKVPPLSVQSNLVLQEKCCRYSPNHGNFCCSSSGKIHKAIASRLTLGSIHDHMYLQKMK